MKDKTMLIKQFEKVIVLLNQKRIEEPKEMLDLIIRKYEKALKIINSKSDSEITYEELSLNGSIRAYLEAYTDWLNPMLGEMDKAEKMAKQLFPWR
jgi:predicted nucleotidyltransferase